MGLGQKLLSWFANRSIQREQTQTPDRKGIAFGQIIGVPATWYSYGYPPKVDWFRMERTFRSFPMVTYAVNEFAEQTTGPGFYIRGDNPRAVDLIQKFADHVNLDQLLIRTARELAITGNCFWERRFDSLQKDPRDPFKLIRYGNLVEVAILPYTTMKIVPDPYTGADPSRGYTQIIFGRYIQFAPEQIAHFKFNVSGGAIGSDFYGMGLIQPVLDYVESLQEMQLYMRLIMRRYAAPKVHWKLGSDQYPPKPEDVKSLQSDLKTIRPDEDYISSYLVQGEVLEPDLRARFEEMVKQFTLTTISGLENPSLILSMSATRVSDASANAMMEAWNRKAATVQTVMKELVQDLLFKQIVAQNGLPLSETPELMWNPAKAEEPKERLGRLIQLLDPTRVDVTPQTRRDIENMLRQELELEPIEPAEALVPTEPMPMQVEKKRLEVYEKLEEFLK